MLKDANRGRNSEKMKSALEIFEVAFSTLWYNPYDVKPSKEWHSHVT